MTVCWHCKNQPADPKQAQKVTLHLGGDERTVRVPVCSTCAAFLLRRAWAMTAVIVLGSFVALMLGVAMGSWVFVGMGGVLVIAVAVMTWRTMTRKAGYRSPGPYPEVKHLTDLGWKLGPVPAATSARKTCSRCGKVVPLSAHSGQSCPHCGAHWSYEHEMTARR